MKTTVSHQTYIRATPPELYRRMTTGGGWEGWFASDASIGERTGEPVRFEWDDFGAQHYTAEDHGRVVILDEEARHFAFTWHPGETETLVSLRFEPCGSGCMLSVEETGYANTEEDRTVALAVATGWGEALTLLKFYVEHGLVYGPVPE